MNQQNSTNQHSTAQNSTEQNNINNANTYTGRPLVTTDNATFLFYDIESLHNVFTVCTYDSVTHIVDAFCLIDDAALNNQLRNTDVTQAVMQANPAWVARCKDANVTPQIRLHLITDDQQRIDENVIDTMATTLGGVETTVNLHRPTHTRNKTNKEWCKPNWAIVCDTEVGYDPTQHRFITGYNSNNYDTVMLATFFYLAAEPNSICTANTLRHHNDNLFADDMRNSMYAYFSRHEDGKQLGDEGGYLSVAGQIRDNWLKSGRHLDIARLNELQSRVGLKRLLGTTGHQILESEKLSGSNAYIANIDELVELISYNISDVVGTALMFEHNVYTGSFNLRSTLLHTYPETIYNHDGSFAKPKIDPYQVRYDRLTCDTSSAKLTAYILAPYRNLHDIPGHQSDRPTVSFCYPDPGVAKELGIEPINVLAMAKEFFYDHVPDTTDSGRKARAAFDEVYAYYKDIEGKNFNQETSAVPTIEEAVDKLHDDLLIMQQHTATTIDKIVNSADAATIDTSGLQKLNTDLSALHKHLWKTLPPAQTLRNAQNTQGNIPHMVDVTTIAALREPLLQIAQHYHNMLALRDPDIIDANGETTTPIALRMADTTRPDGKAAAVTRWAHYICDFFAGYTHTQGLWDEQIAALSHKERTIRWPLENHTHLYTLDDVPRRPNNLDYVFVDADGEVQSTHCFATFSTGGLHGAEYSAGDHDAKRKEFDTQHAKFERVLHQVDTDMREPDQALQRLVEAGASQKITKTMRQNCEKAQDASSWIAEVTQNDELRAKFPTFSRPNGDPYTVEELAAMSWWIRKMLRVAVPTNNPDDPYEIIEHKSVIKSGKADAPILREHFPNVQPAGDIFETTAKGATKLKARYAMTSVDDVMHEDFTSYYPLMLTNMAAFVNPDLETSGTKDRYRDMFFQKERYGKLRKDPSLSPQERDYYSVMREGVKLGLNSASGAADSVFQKKILMNNTILSMRLIGQLLTWWVGQSQAFIGARVTSTNTDGIYATLDIDTVTRTLDTLGSVINVDIEPEPMTLVSKDSNNRIEFAPHEDTDDQDTADQDHNVATQSTAKNPLDREVLACGGSTLAAYFGPSPRKALDHPAISDRIIGEYFKLIADGNYIPEENDSDDDSETPRTTPLTIEEPMHIPTVLKLLENVESQHSAADALVFYQNIIASSVGTMSYLYAIDGVLTDDAVPEDDAVSENDAVSDNGTQTTKQGSITAQDYQLLQHYNRIFMVDDEAVARLGDNYAATGHTPLNIVRIGAAKVRKVPKTTLASRERKGVANRSSLPARTLLKQAGVENLEQLGVEHDLALYRHTGVDSTQSHVIVNRSIHDADEEANKLLLACLDRHAYATMIATKFNENWMNTPGTQAHREAVTQYITQTDAYNSSPIANIQQEIAHTPTTDVGAGVGADVNADTKSQTSTQTEGSHDTHRAEHTESAENPVLDMETPHTDISHHPVDDDMQYCDIGAYTKYPATHRDLDEAAAYCVTHQSDMLCV